MANLKSGVILGEGENLIVELEAELWATSSNPIARFFGAILRIINLILGRKRKGFVVLTDKRIIEVNEKIACWCFNVGKDITYLIPSSIKEVGYMKKGTCCGCFCQAYTLYYDAFTQRTSILLKGFDEYQTKEITDKFYEFVRSAQ